MTGASPAQVAAYDQALATARDLAARGKTVILADAPTGAQCSWCDCPDSEHVDETYRCGGCPAMADAILRVLPERPERKALPVCAPHFTDAMRLLTTVLLGSLPPE
ncbi:hypothetical protein ACIOC1_00255 [Streptomyces sp. NPDC088197]|uniref:hypothetical protein n=1 Tax=Streptomyces sp. NPDC088197 TaxID=3365840 RepID=UPI003827E035